MAAALARIDSGTFENLLVGTANGVDNRLLDAGTAHADDVQPAQQTRVAVEHAIGNKIVGDCREPADKGMTADTGKLVNSRAATENGAVSNRHMACKHDIVGEDDIVAEAAVMRHMRIGKEQIVVADDGGAAMFDSAGIHRHAFADGAVFTDQQRRIDGAVMNALRIATNHR